MIADTEIADRPATELEVTPEMIEAGIVELWNYDPAFSNERDVVEAIFRVMTAARLPRLQQR